jgi:glycosyltransferase involved in cell wall biosynthesis
MSSVNSSGGTERVGSMLANSLSEAGYEVMLGSISYGDKPFFPVNKEVKLLSLMSFPRCKLCRIPNTVYKLRKLLKKESVGALIVVDTLCIQFTLPAVLGLKVKHICWEHFNFNNDLGGSSRRLARQLAARYCDSIVTLTEKDKQYWLKGTRHKSQIIAIANPCPFPPQKSKKQKSTKTVLSVGHLTHIKGFDRLLEAWVRVSRVMPDWRLVIVGEGEDRQKLTGFIKKNNLINSVDLVGRTSDVSEYYKEAEIFCLSSHYEGFPMVLLEALAFGLPVVSFDCDTGPAEILQDTGSILVPQNDIDQLALSLINLMKDKEGRELIGLKSKEKSKLYQPKNIISQWVKLLNN